MNWGDYKSNFFNEPVKDISSIHPINIHTSYLSVVYHTKPFITKRDLEIMEILEKSIFSEPRYGTQTYQKMSGIEN